MTEPEDQPRAEDAALWRRFRALDGESAPDSNALADEALTLAAYAEGRLGGRAAEAVEAWLAAHPEAIGDLAVARQASPSPVEAPPAMLSRAMALVAGDTVVVPFRRPAAASTAWRLTLARVALAASILATSLVGFAMGSNLYSNFSATTESASDPLDQPAGVFTEESGV